METEITKKMKFGNEVAHELGCFDCLPDDVLMSILNRIQDLRCLFQCTLVSKPFASKIFRIKSISLKLPALEVDSSEVITSHEMLRLEFQKISEVCPPLPPRQELKFTKFLKRFTELEYAFFESACPRNPCSFPSFKWEVKLENCTPAVEILVSILPSPICEESESEFEVEADGDDEDGDVELEEADLEDEVGALPETLQLLVKGSLLVPIMSVPEWFVLVFSLIEQHHALKSVICTDSCNHGEIVLNDERIVEWRQKLLCGELSHDAIPIIMSTPSPDLPEGGESYLLLNLLHGLHYDVLKRWLEVQ